MHGILWKWHADHHADNRYQGQTFYVNDLFPLAFAVPSFLSCLAAHLGFLPYWFTLSLVLGAACYGLVYSIFHEEVIHQRFGIKALQKLRKHWYVKRLLKAHHMHHRVVTKEGALAFGFLYAPPKFDRPESVQFDAEETFLGYYAPPALADSLSEYWNSLCIVLNDTPLY